MADTPVTRHLPTRIALTVIAVTVVGAFLAITLDVPSRFVIGEPQRGDLGMEVMWEGSAISAPLPPILGLVVGVLFARRTGAARVTGLGLLALVGLVMFVGVVGEFAGGKQFEGVRQTLFVVFNAAYGLLAITLAGSSVLALFKREARATA